MAEFPETLTVKACAAQMRVSRMTIYRLVNDGTLPAYRVGRSVRIQREDWLAYLRSTMKIRP